jgi:hypothetical protein
MTDFSVRGIQNPSAKSRHDRICCILFELNVVISEPIFPLETVCQPAGKAEFKPFQRFNPTLRSNRERLAAWFKVPGSKFKVIRSV